MAVLLAELVGVQAAGDSLGVSNLSISRSAQKVIAMVLLEAHRRQVEEAIVLAEGPEKLYKSHLERD